MTIPASCEAEDREEGLCTGRCITGCLFLSFFYGAAVCAYCLLSIKAPTGLLPLVATIPHLAALIVFRNVSEWHQQVALR